MKKKEEITLGQLKSKGLLNDFHGKISFDELNDIVNEFISLEEVEIALNETKEFENCFYFIQYENYIKAISLTSNYGLYPFSISLYDNSFFLYIIRKEDIEDEFKHIKLNKDNCVSGEYNEEYIHLFRQILLLYQKANIAKTDKGKIDNTLTDYYSSLCEKYNKYSYINLNNYNDDEPVSEIIEIASLATKQIKEKIINSLNNDRYTLIGQACTPNFTDNVNNLGGDLMFISDVNEDKLKVLDGRTLSFDDKSLRIAYSALSYVRVQNIAFYTQDYTDMMKNLRNEIWKWKEEALDNFYKDKTKFLYWR